MEASRGDFYIQIQRLEKQYGDITPERKDLIWDGLKFQSVAVLAEVISHWIANKGKTPTLEELQSGVRYRSRDRTYKPMEPLDSDGFVPTEKSIDEQNAFLEANDPNWTPEKSKAAKETMMRLIRKREERESVKQNQSAAQNENLGPPANADPLSGI